MKVYLAGPMSGHPSFNIPAFDTAAAALRAAGHEVISPVEMDGPVDREVLMQSAAGSHDDLPRDAQYEGYLDRDYEVIKSSGLDAIVTLPEWERSTGARFEVSAAAIHGIPRYDYDPGDIRGFDPDALYDRDGKWISHEDNPLRQRAVTGAVKDNRGKPMVELLPSKPLLGVAAVLSYGARKYKPNNWRLGLSWTQTMGSLHRHLLAFADGQDIDPENDLPHVDELLCQALFLSEFWHTGAGADDRWSSLSASKREESKA